MSVFPESYTQYWNTRATAPRRVKPFIIAAIHITDNYALMSAMNEAIYSNRIGTGASFTFVNNRNGTTVQCLHPEYQVPFTNGSWLNSNRNLWTVNYAINNGIGANDSTFMTIENVGNEVPSGAPITAAQIEKCAQLVARGSRITGIPINRNTVLGHRDYDSINRLYCPTRYDLNALLGKIITRAQQINAPTPTPAPVDDRVGGLPVNFKNRSGWKAKIKAGKPRRAGARLSSTNFGNTTRNEVFYIWGEVVGDNFGTPNGTNWYFGGQYVGGKNRVVYIPAIDLMDRNF